LLDSGTFERASCSISASSGVILVGSLLPFAGIQEIPVLSWTVGA
jgi:hypothetical protein